jgi:hypothetical protein
VKTITVKVTQEDIEQGKPGVCDACPIALALVRGGADWADVWQGGVLVGGDDGGGDEYVMPKRGQAFVYRFDRGEPVEPSTFRLRAKS